MVKTDADNLEKNTKKLIRCLYFLRMEDRKKGNENGKDGGRHTKRNKQDCFSWNYHKILLKHS